MVGEAIQDIVFNDLKGQVGSDLQLEIRKIYTRRPKEKKWFSSRPSLFTTKAEEVIDDPGVDIVVEVLGFQHETELPVFRDYILRALERGKSVVTSDKAVLARFSKELWAAAKKHGKQLRFEACVGGGIPVIRSLTESFAVEEPEAIFGIVNGTCNYILSQMEKSGRPYADALKEAQQKGYAETNPTADVSGSDAEAKLLLLSAVAFGLQLPPGTTWRKGIEDIHAVDFRYAGRTGSSTIKHLAVAKRTGQAVEVFVSPALVARDNFLAGIDGATNAICFKGQEKRRVARRARLRLCSGRSRRGGRAHRCRRARRCLRTGARRGPVRRTTKSRAGGRSKSSAGGRDHGLFLCALYCERSRRNRRRYRPDFRPLGGEYFRNLAAPTYRRRVARLDPEL